MVTIRLLDEVHVQFLGLTGKQTDYIIEKTKKHVKGSEHTDQYQLGLWDGKKSQFRRSGKTFYFMLDTVIPLLEKLGIDGESITCEDYRDDLPPQPDSIDSGYLRRFGGPELRDGQAEAVNKILKNEKGLIELATNAGKSLVSLTLSSLYDDVFKGFIVVPSQYLQNQMYKDYSKFGLNATRITSKTKNTQEDVDAFLNDYDHYIITWRKLGNIKHLLDGFYGYILWDEAHEASDTMFSVLSEALYNCPIRIGMTGTFPSDKQKLEAIKCHFGGGILSKVEYSELRDQGHALDAHIQPVVTKHRSITKEIANFEDEFDYLISNPSRLKGIGRYLKSLPKKNTLVLCHPDQAEYLSNYLNVPCITKDTKIEDREVLYAAFNTEDDFMLFASYGTSGTGLSIDRISRGVLIDVGKDPIRIQQSIGRFIRLDGENDTVEVKDIYSDANLSKNTHRNKRYNLFKKKKYRYNETVETIKVD